MKTMLFPMKYRGPAKFPFDQSNDLELNQEKRRHQQK